MKWVFFLLLLVSYCGSIAQNAVGLASELPRPDVSKGVHILDLPDKLSPIEEDSLNLFCEMFWEVKEIEVLVCVVPSIKSPFGNPNEKIRNLDDPTYYFIDYLYEEWYGDKYNGAAEEMILILINAEYDDVVVYSNAMPVDYNVEFITNDFQPYLDEGRYYEGIAYYFYPVLEYVLEGKLPDYIEQEDEQDVLEEYESYSSSYNTYLNAEDVPNAMVESGSYVTDPSNYLYSETILSLNKKCDEIRTDKGTEIAIVVLYSISYNVPHDFGVELFNLWGLGREGYDDGLLILMVMDERRVEFITGYGMEETLPDALCYEIQQEDMVPYFKEGDYGKGLVKGLETTIAIIEGAEVPSYVEFYRTKDARWAFGMKVLFILGLLVVITIFANWYYRKYNKDQDKLIVIDIINGVVFGLIPLFIVFHLGYTLGYYATFYVYGFFAVLLAFRWIKIYLLIHNEKDPYLKWQRTQKKEGFFEYMIGFPFGLFNNILVYKLKYWRIVPRFSPDGVLMHLMSEDEEDKFLKKGQITEEKIKSVDYDVWVTEDQRHLLILEYPGSVRKFKKCSKCGFKAWSLVSTKTLKSATYSSKGKREKKYACENCQHKKTTTSIIPMLVRSTSSSSGGYSSSSSYSSGGSWGGGSSGGGGAGSSW